MAFDIISDLWLSRLFSKLDNVGKTVRKNHEVLIKIVQFRASVRVCL